MPYADPEQKAAYQRKYRAKHRAKLDTYMTERRLALAASRRDLLSQFDCHTCGCNDTSVIQWHHVLPEEKLFEVGGNGNRNEDVWWDEVLKCIPLCANCHVKIHKELLCLINPIGYKHH